MTACPELDRVCRAAERLQHAEVALLCALEANGTQPVLDALCNVRRELASRKSEIAMLIECIGISEFERSGVFNG